MAVRESKGTTRPYESAMPAICQMASTLVSSLELSQVLRIVVEETRNLVGAWAVALDLLDEDSSSLRIEAACGLSEAYVQALNENLRPRLDDSPFGQGPGARGVRERQTIWIPSVAEEPILHPWCELIRQEGIAAIVFTPLIFRDKVLGLLNLYFTEVHPLDEDELQICETVAAMSAAAIENARLLRREKEEAEQTAALLDVAQTISSTLELKEVLSQVVERTARMTAADRCSIWLLDEREQTLLPAALYGMEPTFVDDWKACSLKLEDEPLSREAIATGQPVVVTDAMSDPRTDKAAVSFFGDKSILVLPLISKGNALGTLFLNYVHHHHPFSDRDIGVTMAIAAQAATAIGNARLYEESHRRGEKLRASFQQVGMALASSLDVDEVLTLIVKLVGEMLDADACTIRLLDEQSGELVLRASAGLSARHIRVVRPKVGEGWIGLVAQKGEPVYVPDMQADPRTAYPEVVAEQGLRAYLGVPLLLNDRVIGVLSLVRKQPVSFSAEQMELLSSFAHQASIAIERAHLFATVVEERDEIEALVRNSADGILIMDRDRRILKVNPALERVVGWPREQLLGSFCSDVFSSHDDMGHNICETDCPLDRVVDQDQPLFSEHRITTRNDREVDVGISYGPIRDEKGNVVRVVAVVRDISKQKELDRLRSDFVCTVSHELRTPLALIKGYVATLLRQDIALSQDTQRRFLTNIDEAAERLTRLISDLLNVSRMEAGRFELRLQPLDLTELITRVVDRLQPQTGRCRLVAQLPAQPLIVHADADKVEQVLLNLLSNAIKFSPNGGMVTIKAQAVEAPPGIMVSVIDHGEGIPPEQLPRVFDKFFRVEGGLVRKTSGIGLGLYICKSIVEAHGGQIWAKSTLGEGSTFSFILPEHPPVKSDV